MPRECPHSAPTHAVGIFEYHGPLQQERLRIYIYVLATLRYSSAAACGNIIYIHTCIYIHTYNKVMLQVDHSKVEYIPIEKRFYIATSEIKSMTEEVPSPRFVCLFVRSFVCLFVCLLVCSPGPCHARLSPQ